MISWMYPFTGASLPVSGTVSPVNFRKHIHTSYLTFQARHPSYTALSPRSPITGIYICILIKGCACIILPTITGRMIPTCTIQSYPGHTNGLFSMNCIQYMVNGCILPLRTGDHQKNNTIFYLPFLIFFFFFHLMRSRHVRFLAGFSKAFSVRLATISGICCFTSCSASSIEFLY